MLSIANNINDISNINHTGTKGSRNGTDETEEIMDFVKISNLPQSKSIRPTGHHSDSDDTDGDEKHKVTISKRKTTSKSMSVAPTSHTDIFIGVDKFVQDVENIDKNEASKRKSMHDTNDNNIETTISN